MKNLFIIIVIIIISIIIISLSLYQTKRWISISISNELFLCTVLRGNRILPRKKLLGEKEERKKGEKQRRRRYGRVEGRKEG